MGVWQGEPRTKIKKENKMNADKIAETCLKSKHLVIQGDIFLCGACWKLIEQAIKGEK